MGAAGDLARPTADGLPARFRKQREGIRIRNDGGDHPGTGLVALYARFSSPNQKFASIAIQLSKARAIAEKLGFIIYKEYSDVAKSGRNVIFRDEFNAMMKDAVEKRFKNVIIYNVSRFTRNWRHGIKEFDRLVDVGVKLFNLEQELSENDFLDQARKAEAFIDGQLSICQDGRENAANEGRRPLSPAFGLMITPGEPGVHVPHPKHSVTVRMIFRLLNRGIGSTTVAHILTKAKRPTPRDAQIEAYNKRNKKNQIPLTGASWTSEMVIRISRNAVYKGQIWYGTSRGVKNRDGTTIARISPPEEEWARSKNEAMRLVSDEMYDAVQHRDNNRNQPSQKRPPRQFPFSNLVRCDLCGKPMKISTREGSPAYTCSENYDPFTNDRCPGSGYHDLAKVDRIVLEMMAAEANDGRRAAKFRRNYATRLEQLTSAEDERVAALDETYERCRTHSIDLVDIQARNNRLDRSDRQWRPPEIMEAAIAAANAALAAADAARKHFSRSTVDTNAVEELDTLEAAFRRPDLILDASLGNLDGERLKMALRRIIVSIALGRIDKQHNSIRAVFRLPNPDGVDADWPAVTANHVYDRKTLRQTIEAEEAEKRRRRLRGIAASGEHALSPEAYAIVEACARRFDFADDRIALREVADAMIFHKKAGVAWTDVPDTFGDWSTLDKVRGRLVAGGVWDAILDDWDATCPEVYGDFSRRDFALSAIRRQSPKPKPEDFVLTAAEIRAAMPTATPTVRLRLKAAALFIEGATAASIARSLDIHPAVIGQYIRRYAPARKVSDFEDGKKSSFLSSGEVSKIETFIRDKKSRKEPISLETVFRFCKTEIGVSFSSPRSLAGSLATSGIHLYKKVPEGDQKRGLVAARAGTH